MGVIQFIPGAKNIIDRREEGKSYWIAECDLCETKFYPKRSNARFCSNQCQMKNYRERLAKGLVNQKKTKKKQKIVIEPTLGDEDYDWTLLDEARGKDDLVLHLKNKCDVKVYGQILKLKSIKIGGTYDIEDYRIKRVNSVMYEIYN